MTTPRNTQFAGFAKLVLAEMLAQTQWDGMDFNSDDTEEVEKYSAIIAKRAYDLACHTTHELDRLRAFYYGYKDEVGSTPEQMIKGVPDMTTLPEVSQ